VKGVGTLGRAVRRRAERAGDILALLTLLVRPRTYLGHPARRRIVYTVFRRQFRDTGVQALMVTILVALLVGFLLVFLLPASSAREQLLPTFSDLYILVIVRELGPVMCAMILIARAGTAITAKIGYLKIFREYESMHIMGIDPVALFFVPIFWAFPLAMLLLVVYFNLFALVAAYFALSPLDPGFGARTLLDTVIRRVDFQDILVVSVKCLASGFIVGLYSIYFGAQMRGRMHHVTQAMQEATTRQFIGVFTVNVIISVLVYSR
jgi:phospholipid/cholesterol/gamma-HCH transport system permease protein